MMLVGTSVEGSRTITSHSNKVMSSQALSLKKIIEYWSLLGLSSDFPDAYLQSHSISYALVYTQLALGTDRTSATCTLAYCSHVVDCTRTNQSYMIT
jgi:hypothetical protein